MHRAERRRLARCRVHFMRNLLATVPHAMREPIAAIVRTISRSPTTPRRRRSCTKSPMACVRGRPGRGAARGPADDILAHKHFPEEHRRQLHSTNPLERLNKEIKRRST